MIKFEDLFYISLDLTARDEITIVIDGGLPDRMMVKSAVALYRGYNVIWFTGKMFGISKSEVI